MSIAGVSVVRNNLREKLTGEAEYSADLKLPGMLHGQIFRSLHPHAEILSIDSSQAARLPGVHAIVTPFDVPLGRLAPDIATLDTRVRFVGDEVLGRWRRKTRRPPFKPWTSSGWNTGSCPLSSTRKKP